MVNNGSLGNHERINLNNRIEYLEHLLNEAQISFIKY